MIKIGTFSLIFIAFIFPAMTGYDEASVLNYDTYYCARFEKSFNNKNGWHVKVYYCVKMLNRNKTVETLLAVIEKLYDTATNVCR